MKIQLTYGKDYYGNYVWTLTTEKGLGLQVNYIKKPTKKQIRKQCKAVYQASVDSWGKSYSIDKGRMI